MTTSHLNLKFTVADTDRILELARLNWSIRDICNDFKSRRRYVTPGEIGRICTEARVHVSRYRRA